MEIKLDATSPNAHASFLSLSLHLSVDVIDMRISSSLFRASYFDSPAMTLSNERLEFSYAVPSIVSRTTARSIARHGRKKGHRRIAPEVDTVLLSCRIKRVIFEFVELKNGQ